ncbi:glycosyltransferase family 2 protein [Sphingomonas oleivorans]|nr:glycosyltransferase [Sphingomonas oleivorans]
MNAVRIAVIIPYFQREAGILSGCLASIAGQRLPDATELDMIVIDDGSPVPPSVDLEEIMIDPPHSLRIITQPNRGPGAARNTGLDNVPPDAAFVAFIDSDDRWAPDHLATALAMLGEDRDFYFCDSDMPPSTLFAGLDTFTRIDGPSIFAALDGRPDAFMFDPAEVTHCMAREYLCQTSTIVFRWPCFRDLRFDTRLRYAGEDWLMWVRMAQRSRRICFSTAVNGQRGEGVNLYRGAHDRLSSKNLRRLASMVKANALMAAEPGIDRRTRDMCQARQKAARTEIAGIMMHPAGLRSALDPETARSLALLDEGIWLQLPSRWASLISAKLSARRNRARLGETA